MTNGLSTLFAFYGLFLSACGIISVLLIGSKAKTALMSGGLSGVSSLLVAWFIRNGSTQASFIGLGIAFMLFGVFSWRSAKTLFKIFELLPSQSTDLRGKAIAFLIISLMAIVSMMVVVISLICLF